MSMSLRGGSGSERRGNPLLDEETLAPGASAGVASLLLRVAQYKARNDIERIERGRLIESILARGEGNS
jgi:hypothetical protein